MAFGQHNGMSADKTKAIVKVCKIFTSSFRWDWDSNDKDRTRMNLQKRKEQSLTKPGREVNGQQCLKCTATVVRKDPDSFISDAKLNRH